MRTKTLKKNKINVITLGCSKNVYDSEVLMGQLKASGKEVVHEEEGNIVVINTCGFINNAKEESVNTILDYMQKKEDGDVDNDGDKDKSDKYLMKRRGAIGNAIATRKEEFIHEAETEDSNTQTLDYIKGKVKNKVTISPIQGGNEKVRIVAHNELEGELIAETGYSKFLKKVHSLQEKAVSQNQQQLAAMAIEYLDGNMPDASDAVKQMAKMGRKELKKFAKTKHKGLPEKVKEEMDCGSDDKKKKNGEEEDPRSSKTKDNLRRNYLRAMGLKMSYEPEGEVLEDYMRVNSDGSRERVAGDPPKAKLKRKPLGHTPEQQRQMNKQPKTDYRARPGESD